MRCCWAKLRPTYSHACNKQPLSKYHQKSRRLYVFVEIFGGWFSLNLHTFLYTQKKKTLFSAVLLLRWLFSVFQWFEAMFRILHTYRILIYFYQPRENKRGTGRIVKDYRQKAYLYRWASGKRAIRANIFHFVHFSLWFSSNCPILQ